MNAHIDGPPPALLASRYREPRTLRTRATGTPFRVVWRSGSLIIIPGSGIERSVELEELRSAWPMIVAGATRTALKAVTKNSSYLESVCDDMDGLEGAKAAADRAVVSEPARPEVAADDTNLRSGHVAGLLESANLEIHRIEDQLRAEQARGAALERERGRESSSTDGLERTVRRLQGELLQANQREHELTAKLAEARDRIAASEQRHSREAPQELVLKIGENTFDSKHQIHPDLWEILHEAGQLALKYPSGSVANSRRALEAAVGHLWRQATGGIGTPKVADMLSDLHGHRLVPISDWHLAKNIYSRASAIVHDGTKRPDQALWIFFGALQICELVQTDDPTP